MTSLTVAGRSISIAHLQPFVLFCPCSPIGRPLRIEVGFSNHCYTEGFDASRHEAADIVLREHNRVGRVFDELRYALSFNLPKIMDALPTTKVNVTPEQRNYVYATLIQLPADDAGDEASASPMRTLYEVFFSLRRAPRGVGHDLHLFVESAYPRIGAPLHLPKRPSSIRFHVLAYKVFQSQRISFSAR